MFYFLFKSRFFFQELSKFTNPLSSNVIFRSNLHHIQMDATLFSYCHRVLIQFSGPICTTCMVNIDIIVESHSRACILVNKFLKLKTRWDLPRFLLDVACLTCM
jgi:hypothetical protein